MPHSAINVHMLTEKSRCLINHAPRGRGKPWAFSELVTCGMEKVGIPRNHALCGRGKTESFRKYTTYGGKTARVPATTPYMVKNGETVSTTKPYMPGFENSVVQQGKGRKLGSSLCLV